MSFRDRCCRTSPLEIGTTGDPWNDVPLTDSPRILRALVGRDASIPTHLFIYHPIVYDMVAIAACACASYRGA
jgi:hypothetical protein